MFTLLKLACLATYALALASLAGLLPAGAFAYVRMIAAILLVLHTLELVFLFRHVRLYRGPLAISVILTLLFGLLHWKPLVDAKARGDAIPFRKRRVFLTRFTQFTLFWGRNVGGLVNGAGGWWRGGVLLAICVG